MMNTIYVPTKQGSTLWTTAHWVSLVMHPFIVTPVGMVLILWLDGGDLLEALGWTALCSAFVIGPALIRLRRKVKNGQYSDADVSVREHRYGFYIFGALSMILCFGLLLLAGAPRVLVASFSAALVAVILSMLINRFWTKVSVHAGVAMGLTVALAFYSWPLAALSLAGTLLVSWARVVLGRHSWLQVIIGWMVAILCVVGVFGIWLG